MLMAGFGVHDIVRAAIVAVVVGTILTVVNLGAGAFKAIFAGAGEPWKVAMNYGVPFLVSTITSILIHRSTRSRV